MGHCNAMPAVSHNIRLTKVATGNCNNACCLAIDKAKEGQFQLAGMLNVFARATGDGV